MSWVFDTPKMNGKPVDILEPATRDAAAPYSSSPIQARNNQQNPVSASTLTRKLVMNMKWSVPLGKTTQTSYECTYKYDKTRDMFPLDELMSDLKVGGPGVKREDLGKRIVVDSIKVVGYRNELPYEVDFNCTGANTSYMHNAIGECHAFVIPGDTKVDHVPNPIPIHTAVNKVDLQPLAYWGNSTRESLMNEIQWQNLPGVEGPKGQVGCMAKEGRMGVFILRNRAKLGITDIQENDVDGKSIRIPATDGKKVVNIVCTSVVDKLNTTDCNTFTGTITRPGGKSFGNFAGTTWDHHTKDEIAEIGDRRREVHLALEVNWYHPGFAQMALNAGNATRAENN